MYAQTSLSNKSALAKRWPNGALHFVSDGTSMSIAVDEPTEEKFDVADAAILEVRLALYKKSENEESNGHETHRLQRDARKPTETMDEAVLQLPTMAITDR